MNRNKTPEEIKKGIECCSDENGYDGDCTNCPYKGEQWCGDKLKLDALSYILKLESCLNVETEPVRHGRWSEKCMSNNMLSVWACSECNYMFDGITWKYCPNCGAKMDAEVTE